MFTENVNADKQTNIAYTYICFVYIVLYSKNA